MANATFDTDRVLLQTLLRTCEDDKLQLAAKEGDGIPTTIAHDSGLELIEAD